MLAKVIISSYFVLCNVLTTTGTQDDTTIRPNTLFDDADDIQRQLDNEARDKMFYGKKIFRRHKKNKLRKNSTLVSRDWTYKGQNQWYKLYTQCGGRSQSPVDLPAGGLVSAKGGRHIYFINYDVTPQRLILNKDGRRIVMYGEWKYDRQPLVYGGAVFSRRYVFQSLTLHSPSEHRIGGIQFPLETQVLHISADFRTLEEASAASKRDPQAVLGIVNLYKYKNHTQRGLEEILNVAHSSLGINTTLTARELGYFSPPLQQYVCYQGSLTTPPCTESVIWLVRAKALPVTREHAEIAMNLLEDGTKGSFLRQPQPLNDRRVFYFN